MIFKLINIFNKLYQYNNKKFPLLCPAELILQSKKKKIILRKYKSGKFKIMLK